MNDCVKISGCTVSIHLKPCPWCKKTPSMKMPLHQLSEYDKAWRWCIYCNCEVRSETFVSIRNTSKTQIERLINKIIVLAGKWNNNNPCKAYEMKVIDLKDVPNLWVK